MSGRKLTTDEESPDALRLLKKQRSHLLFVLSNPKTGHESVFREWYQGAYLRHVLDSVGVLRGQHYEQHEIDITQGKYPLLPYKYLGLYDLSLDGAQEAEGLIERILALHSQHVAAELPATWIYYPAGEKVGRAPAMSPSLLTLAFANSVPGQESVFQEWYTTRHIRHALSIPALVSGQCYERAQFQRPGAMQIAFETIAIYEQEDSPEALLKSAASLPPGTLHFPMLDRSRFAECVYRPV